MACAADGYSFIIVTFLSLIKYCSTGFEPLCVLIIYSACRAFSLKVTYSKLSNKLLVLFPSL